jgi:hypothetical protein
LHGGVGDLDTQIVGIEMLLDIVNLSVIVEVIKEKNQEEAFEYAFEFASF